MATANPEKTARMKLAVREVLAGRMDYKQAGARFDLHPRSVANAACKARRDQRMPGLHPALMVFA